MTGRRVGTGGLPPEFLNAATSSFSDFLSVAAPHLLPARRLVGGELSGSEIAPHGTTIVGAAFAGGVVVAGDRRATMGNTIAQRDARKVHVADDFTVVGYAGSVAFGMEFIRLFQLELEHYEKVEGIPLTLDGKANRLAAMVRAHLPMAMQGFVAVPLLAGVDTEGPTPVGRIYDYDPAGGCSPQRAFHAIGSGSPYAKSSLKKSWREDGTAAQVQRWVVEALYDAADEDTATGGPDTIRGIYPTVFVIDADGARQVPEHDVVATVDEIMAAQAPNQHG